MSRSLQLASLEPASLGGGRVAGKNNVPLGRLHNVRRRAVLAVGRLHPRRPEARKLIARGHDDVRVDLGPCPGTS